MTPRGPGDSERPGAQQRGRTWPHLPGEYLWGIQCACHQAPAGWVGLLPLSSIRNTGGQNALPLGASSRAGGWKLKALCLSLLLCPRVVLWVCCEAADGQGCVLCCVTSAASVLCPYCSFFTCLSYFIFFTSVQLLLSHESEPRDCWNVCPQLLPLCAWSCYPLLVLLTPLSFKCAPVQWLGRARWVQVLPVAAPELIPGMPSAGILLHLAAGEGGV